MKPYLRPTTAILWGALSVSPSTMALDLRIMSFNVQQPWGTNWDGRKAQAATILNRELPDVVGTQEATKDQINDLLASCPGYSKFGSGRDGGDAGETSAIFWKSSRFRLDEANSGNLWLSNTPSTPSRYGGSYNRIATYVRLVDQKTNAAFRVYNIHNYMPAESDYRLQAAKLLVKTIAARSPSDEPVVLTGDFNSTEGDAVTIWMKSGSDNPLRFRDTYRDVDPTGNVTTGFGTKFDYIYLPKDSKATTVRSYVVTSPVASDHFPIVADLSLNSATSIRSDRVSPSGRSLRPRIEVTRSDVTVRFSPASTMVLVEVLDPRGSLLQTSTGAGDVHRFEARTLPKGALFLRVRSKEGMSVQPFVVP